MAWQTHTVCSNCWKDRVGPLRDPVRLRNVHCREEICCTCGRTTSDGIFLRLSASQVPFCACSREEEEGAFEP